MPTLCMILQNTLSTPVRSDGIAYIAFKLCAIPLLQVPHYQCQSINLVATNLRPCLIPPILQLPFPHWRGVACHVMSCLLVPSFFCPVRPPSSLLPPHPSLLLSFFSFLDPMGERTSPQLQADVRHLPLVICVTVTHANLSNPTKAKKKAKNRNSFTTTTTGTRYC